MIHRARLMGMLKPTPSFPPPFDAIELLIPMTSPFMLTRGPPELPGLIAASVWMKSWLTTSGSSSICRPRALMIPWLTECRQAKWASQRHHPGSDRGLVAVAQPGRRQIVAAELEDGDVGLGIRPDLHRQDRPAVAQKDADLGRLRAVDNVMIGQDEKAGGVVAANDDARAGFLELAGTAVFLGAGGLPRDDVNHRRRDRLGHQLERPVHLLELFVLFRQDVIDRFVGDFLASRRGASSRRCGQFAATRTGHLSRDDRAASSQDDSQHDSRKQAMSVRQ